MIQTAHITQSTLIHTIGHRTLALIKASELQAVGANTVAIGITDIAAIVAECSGWARCGFRTCTVHSSRWSQRKHLKKVKVERKEGEREGRKEKGREGGREEEGLVKGP